MSFNKKNFMDMTTRFSQMQKEAEKKKLLVKKIQSKNENNKKTKKTKPDKKRNSLGCSEQDLFKIDVNILSTIHSQNKFFYSEETDADPVEVKAGDAYISLIAIILQMKKQPSICLVHSWPNGFDWPGFAHVLANRVLSILNNKPPGMRVALYPFNRANYSRYKKTFFSIDTFLKEVQEHATLHKNSLDLLTKRDHAFLTLNSLEDDNQGIKNIVLRAIAPTFEWHDEKQQWIRVGESYLKEVRSDLHWAKSSGRKEKIDDYAEIQDNPNLSEDGIFLIGKKYTPSMANKVLVNAENKFDVIIFDIREKMITNLKNWRGSVAKLATYISITENAPSLLILCDNPVFYTEIQYQINELVNKKIKKTTILPKKLNVFHLMNEEKSVWNFSTELSDPQCKSNPMFSVDVMDKVAMDKIHIIIKCARSLSDELPDAKNELLKLSGFLKNLIEMPIGQKDTRSWLRDKTQDFSASHASYIYAKYDWHSYKQALIIRLNELDIFKHHQVDKALQAADEVIKISELHTEIQLKLQDILNIEHLSSKKMLIIIPYAQHKEFFQSYLNKCMHEKWKSKIDLRIQSDIIDYSQYQIMIIAGKSERMLSTLLLSDILPEKINILMSAYGAERIERILKILLLIPEFSKIKFRAQKILEQIQEILSSMGRIGFDNRDIENIDNFNINYDHDYEQTEIYALIDLYQYGLYPVGKHSTLIKFNLMNQSSYHAVGLDQIDEGDRILILDDYLKEQMESFLNKSGTDLKENAKELLKSYFSQAKKSLERDYNFKTFQRQAQEILNKMFNINAKIEVTIDSVKRWIKWIQEYEHYDDEFQLNSAQNILNFTIFAEALSIDKILAEHYFNNGIRKHRTSRILEGKQIGSQLKIILTNASRPESMGLSVEQYNSLMEMAKESTYTIKMIHYTDEEKVNDYAIGS